MENFRGLEKLAMARIEAAGEYQDQLLFSPPNARHGDERKNYAKADNYASAVKFAMKALDELKVPVFVEYGEMIEMFSDFGNGRIWHKKAQKIRYNG